jgi:hypothetical protein
MPAARLFRNRTKEPAMKKLLLLAMLATLLSACDDFPFHDEGWHGGGHWDHGHGHDD